LILYQIVASNPGGLFTETDYLDKLSLLSIWDWQKKVLQLWRYRPFSFVIFSVIMFHDFKHPLQTGVLHDGVVVLFAYVNYSFVYRQGVLVG